MLPTKPNDIKKESSERMNEKKDCQCENDLEVEFGNIATACLASLALWTLNENRSLLFWRKKGVWWKLLFLAAFFPVSCYIKNVVDLCWRGFASFCDHTIEWFEYQFRVHKWKSYTAVFAEIVENCVPKPVVCIDFSLCGFMVVNIRVIQKKTAFYTPLLMKHTPTRH